MHFLEVTMAPTPEEQVPLKQSQENIIFFDHLII
jgi:hypothetical protein